jgi:hypothetical protein
MISTVTVVPTDSHAEKSRRNFPRLRKLLHAAYFNAENTKFPAFVLNIGGGGLCILTREPLTPDIDSIPVVTLIEDEPLQLAGVIRWRDTVPVKGKEHYLYGLKLQQISDRDWERMMNFSIVGGVGDVKIGEILSATQRDMMITSEEQLLIARLLVDNERLQPFADERLPLIEYTFGGYAMSDGTPFYKLTIRSRDQRGGDTVEFHSDVLVGIESTKVQLLEP